MSGVPVSEGAIECRGCIVGDHPLQAGADDVGAAGEALAGDQPVDRLEQFFRQLHRDLGRHTISIPIRITARYEGTFKCMNMMIAC